MTPKKIFLEINNAFKRGRSDGINFTVQNYSAAVLLCLKDKFDFTPDQLKKTAEHINDTFDSICAGYLSLNDIAETLKEEDDIDITFNGKVVLNEH